MKNFVSLAVAIICLFVTSTIFSQQEKEDSLEYIIEHRPNDSLKLDAMLAYLDLTYSKYPEKAKRIAFETIEIAQELGNVFVETGAYFALALINHTQSKFEEAIKYYLKAIDGYTSIKYRNIDEGLSNSYNNLGLIYNIQENLDKALKYYNKSIEYIDTTNYAGKDSYYATLINISVIYAKKDEIDKAKKYALEVAEFYEDTDDYLSQALAYQTLGTLAGEEKNIALVDKYFEKALFSVNKSGIPLHRVRVLSGHSTTYSQLNDHDKALKYALKADSLINEHNIVNLYDINNVKAVIAQSNFALGNYKLAYEVMEDRIKINDSLYNIEISKSNQELIEKYESEKKEKEISLLKEKDKVSQLEINQKDYRLKLRTYFIITLSLLIILLLIISLFVYRQIKLKQQKKSAELEHKALRTQMNPHFVFNALNSIQRMYLEGNIDKASSFMSDFGELMRKILENSNHYTISLKEEIMALELYLNLEKLRCQNKFTYNFDIDPSIDLTTTKVPPLIVQPFVENAIWHGILPKDGNGHINISISKEKNRLKFQIQDDGVGIQEKHATDHQSKGIEITEQRIGSKLLIESKENEYTTITFYLKVDF